MRKVENRGKLGLSEAEPTPAQVVQDLTERLRARLPVGWAVELELNPRVRRSGPRGGNGPDAELTILGADGDRGSVPVMARRRLDPKLVPVATDWLARHSLPEQTGAGMVVAPFLSPRARQLLTEVGLAYGDAVGNLRLALDRPALYVETQGAASDPWMQPGDRPLRSLKGPVAGRIVRALCDYWPPFRVEQLVELSGASVGSVARVFAFLDPEGLIVRESRGPVTAVRWADLIRRWAEDYAFARTNRTQTFLEPRGLTTLLGKLKNVPFGYAVTGSLAATQVAPVAAPRLAMVYVPEIARAATELRLRPAETGANVMLAEPFDLVVFERSQERDDVTYAAWSQVAVDLLTGPGRSPAEGEELLHWMERHEDAWRA